MSRQLQSLLEPVAHVARLAGDRILEVYGTEFSVARKEDRSPLTAADMASHRTILEGLGEITPEVPVLSEESAETPFGERSAWPEYWLVDPLDGTREFIQRNGEFSVNIALIRDHRPVLGIVHVPVTGLDYGGCSGYGAFRRRGQEAATRISVSRRAREPVRVVGSRSHRGASLDRYLRNLGEYELLSMGSSLKFCLVAEGQADVYPRLGPTSEWDTAAAQAVVECAGGQVTDTTGKTLLYNRKADLLNPHFLVFGDSSRDWTSFL